MNRTRFMTGRCGWTKLLATNSTAASFNSRIPTVTDPTANVNLIHRNDNGPLDAALQLIFCGAGADNATGSFRVIGWAPTNGSVPLWIPTVMHEYDVTLSAAVGVAGADAINTDRFADTIAAATGTYPSGTVLLVGGELISNANDVISHVTIGTKGFHYIEVSTKVGTATNLNCFYRWL
jgi:hypothetical protein